MNIIWNENPFNTSVELDDRDKTYLLLSYQTERFADIFCDVNLRIKAEIGSGEITVDEIEKKISKWGDIYNLTIDSDEIKELVSYLNSGHCGDCICVACTCMNCYVQEYLGIDTLKGLGKHSAHKVIAAFDQVKTNSIDDAIEYLSKKPEYIKGEAWKNHSQESYEKHIPRWETERLQGIKWLKLYKEKHNF
jgi:hypothetical protein